MAFEPTLLSNEMALAWLEAAGFRVRSRPLQWDAWSEHRAAVQAREAAAEQLPEQERQVAQITVEEDTLVRQMKAIAEGLEQARDLQDEIRKLRLLLQSLRQAVNSSRRRSDGPALDSAEQELAGVQRSIDALAGAGAGGDFRSTISALRSALNRLRVARNRVGGRLQRASEDAQHSRELLNPDPPARLDNLRAVTVNFELTGVRVRWGGPAGALDNGPVDPVFAVATVRFLQAARRELGLEAVFSSGFFRVPRGPLAGGHSQGKSWDILGFRASGADLRLRTGRMIDPGQRNFANEHSDWFDTREISPGLTREAMMRRFVEVLSRFYGHVIGPGHDAKHDAHFHADSVDHFVGVDVPATRANPRPYATNGRRAAHG